VVAGLPPAAWCWQGVGAGAVVQIGEWRVVRAPSSDSLLSHAAQVVHPGLSWAKWCEALLGCSPGVFGGPVWEQLCPFGSKRPPPRAAFPGKGRLCGSPRLQRVCFWFALLRWLGRPTYVSLAAPVCVHAHPCGCAARCLRQGDVLLDKVAVAALCASDSMAEEMLRFDVWST
jgi:hypothetical protein